MTEDRTEFDALVMAVLGLRGGEKFGHKADDDYKIAKHDLSPCRVCHRMWGEHAGWLCPSYDERGQFLMYKEEGE